MRVFHTNSRLVRRSIVALVAAALVATIGVIPAAGAEGKAKGVDLSGVTLAVGGQNGGDGPIAEASGAFKNAPYKIEWTNQGTSTGNMTALMAGAINVGGAGDLAVMFLQANQVPAWTKSNIPVTIVGFSLTPQTVADKYPPFELLVGKDSGIKRLSDLKGKTIAYAPGGDINKFFLKILVAAHLKLDDVKPVTLNTPVGAAALAAGQVDAAILNYYFTLSPLSAGAKVVATSNDKGIETPLAGTTIVPTKDLKDPKIAAALDDYLARVVKYNDWKAKHPDAVALALVKYLNLDADSAKLQAQSSQGQLVPITPQLLADTQSSADLLYQNGVLAHQVDTSIGFTTKFNPTIEKALASLQTPKP